MVNSLQFSVSSWLCLKPLSWFLPNTSGAGSASIKMISDNKEEKKVFKYGIFWEIWSWAINTSQKPFSQLNNKARKQEGRKEEEKNKISWVLLKGKWSSATRFSSPFCLCMMWSPTTEILHIIMRKKKITEYLSFEGTFRVCLTGHPCSKGGQLQQVAQGHI